MRLRSPVSAEDAKRQLLITVDEGCIRYCVGRQMMMKLAYQAGAIIEIGTRHKRINLKKMDAFLGIDV